MSLFNTLPLALGLVLFSFLLTSISIVPFINLLYKLKLTRRKEAPKKGKIPLFDKLHDLKAGTPLGGGILIIFIVTMLFLFLFPFASRMGVFIRSSFEFKTELFLIIFTFISFGILGLSDDIIKTFGRPRPGTMGMWLGMSRKVKFLIQWLIAFFIGYVLYQRLGIDILYIPFLNSVLKLSFWYVPFAAFVIVSFSNAFNITDGLDGLASGLLFICLAVFGVIAASNLDTPLSLFIALWLGSLIAFLYFNVWPARIFLGDAGALSFGAMLAVIGLLTGNIIAMCVVGGLFVVEIVSSAIQIIGWKYLKKIKPFVSIFDKKLFFLSLLLTTVGLIAIADASGPLAQSRFSDQYYFFKQQVVWSVVGVILMVIFSKIPYILIEKSANFLFFSSIIFLIIVFIPGIGVRVLGATRWINLGFTTFQPSEFAKLTLIIYIAKISSKNLKGMAYFLPVFLTSLLVMLQPDLGTTIVLIATSFIQIFVSGLNLIYVFGSVVVGATGALVLILTSEYRRNRLMTFLNMSEDPLNKGYHIRQVLLALGSGGLFGVGIGESRQKYLFLPETATDSIFAVIAEEVGFLGSTLLIFLFVLFVIRGFVIAKKAPDKFSKVLAIGLTSWIGIQAVVNIGSMVALLPITGVPLPFISFGGTSLVMMLIATGILLNISRYGEK